MDEPNLYNINTDKDTFHILHLPESYLQSLSIVPINTKRILAGRVCVRNVDLQIELRLWETWFPPPAYFIKVIYNIQKRKCKSHSNLRVVIVKNYLAAFYHNKIFSNIPSADLVFIKKTNQLFSSYIVIFCFTFFKAPFHKFECGPRNGLCAEDLGRQGLPLLSHSQPWTEWTSYVYYVVSK